MMKDYWLRSESLKVARMIPYTIIELGGWGVASKAEEGLRGSLS
jgi:hypothetical protein